MLIQKPYIRAYICYFVLDFVKLTRPWPPCSMHVKQLFNPSSEKENICYPIVCYPCSLGKYAAKPY